MTEVHKNHGAERMAEAVIDVFDLLDGVETGLQADHQQNENYIQLPLGGDMHGLSENAMTDNHSEALSATSEA